MTGDATDLQAQEFDPAAAARHWWRALNGLGEGKTQSGKDRAALARLRRASSREAMTEEATLRLFRALRYKNPARLPRVATLAAALSTIRQDRPGRFGREIGRATIDDEASAALKLGRFKRLLDAQTEEEIATAFRRAIAILGDAANVRDVARCLLEFEDEDVRRRLIFDYYAAGESEDEAANAVTPSASNPV